MKKIKNNYTNFILTMIAVVLFGINYHLFSGEIISKANAYCIKSIYKKLAPFVNKTPLIHTNKTIEKIVNTNLFLKLEFLQHSGSFKARGALNNILNLSQTQKNRGVTAVSAGNHAIATSYAAKKFRVKNKVFMYDSANSFRINKVKK